MKKLLGVLAMGLACAMLAACNPSGGSTPTPGPGGDDMDKVLSVNDFEKFSVVGQHSIIVNGEDVKNEWNIKDYNEMTAISLNTLKAKDAALEAVVQAKGVRGLYIKEGVVLGATDAGYSDKSRPADDGTIINNVNGSYTFKVCGAEENDEGVWMRATHYPSAEVHGESLTSNLWITENMTDQPDDNGYDHNTDPVAKEAGVYTVVFALYKEAKGDLNLACGIGLIKTAERDPYQPPATYPIQSVDVAGGHNGWNPSDADKLTQDGNTFSGEFTIEDSVETKEVKVRINCEWSVALGATALSTKVVTNNDGNIVLEAGTYVVTVTFKTLDDIKVGDEVEAFTIEAKGGAQANDGSEEHPFTVAEALAFIAELDDNETTTDKYYVVGVVTSKQSNEKDYETYDFWMGDSAEDTNTLQAFRALAKADYDNLKVGDMVLLNGKFQKYMKNGNPVPEIKNVSWSIVAA